jgi:hypothetical protein
MSDAASDRLFLGYHYLFAYAMADETQPVGPGRLRPVLVMAARANLGYWSASQVSKEYCCSYQRVLTMLYEGRLKGELHAKRPAYLIDPADLTPAVLAELKSDARTHKLRAGGPSVGIPPRDRSKRPAHVNLARVARAPRLTVIKNGSASAAPSGRAAARGAALVSAAGAALPDESSGRVGRPGEQAPAAWQGDRVSAPAPDSRGLVAVGS